MKTIVNCKTVNVDKIAYDRCHKIYVLESVEM